MNSSIEESVPSGDMLGFVSPRSRITETHNVESEIASIVGCEILKRVIPIPTDGGNYDHVDLVSAKDLMHRNLPA